MPEKNFGEKVIIGCRLCGFSKVIKSVYSVDTLGQKPGNYSEIVIFRIAQALMSAGIRNREIILDNWDQYKAEHKEYSADCTGGLEKLS